MTKKQVKKDEKVISEPETEEIKQEIEEVEEVPVSKKKKEVTEAQRAHLATIRVKALKVKAERKALREKAKQLETAELQLKAEKYDKTIIESNKLKEPQKEEVVEEVEVACPKGRASVPFVEEIKTGCSIFSRPCYPVVSSFLHFCQ